MTQIVIADDVEKVRAPYRPGYVYFVCCGQAGPVKIGFAEDVGKRIGQLQTAHHEQLYLIRIEPGTFVTETWLHERFAALRRRGEWFDYHPDLLTVVVPPLEMLNYRPRQFWDWPAAFPEATRQDCLAAISEIERRANLVLQPGLDLRMCIRLLKIAWEENPEASFGEAAAVWANRRKAECDGVAMSSSSTPPLDQHGAAA